jgi:hypothetical protein
MRLLQHKKLAAASPANVTSVKSAARKTLSFAHSSYEDGVARLPQNRVKARKKHLHPRENRTTIGGA